MLKVAVFLSIFAVIASCAKDTNPKSKNEENPTKRYQTFFEGWTLEDEKKFSHRVRFRPNLPREASRGQRILFIENGPPPVSALLRFRKRVIEFYRPNSEGEYEAWNPEIKVSKKTHEFFFEILEEDAKISDFDKFFEEHSGKVWFDYEPVNYKMSTGHLPMTFNFIAEVNPDAQFVFVPRPFPSHDEICKMGSDPSVLQKYLSKYEQVDAKTLQLINAYDLNFLNASHGPGEQWAKSMLLLCEDKSASFKNSLVKFIDAHREFYLKLANIKDFLVFKSGNNYYSEFDCASPYTGNTCYSSDQIFTVGYLEQKILHDSEDGLTEFDELIPDRLRESEGSVDIFVNAGFESNDDLLNPKGDPGPNPVLLANIFAVGRGLYGIMSTSMATPMALSLANYFIQNGVSIEELPGKLKGRAFDPLNNDQFLRPHIPIAVENKK